MNDRELDAIRLRLKRGEEIQLRLTRVVQVLEYVQGHPGTSEADAVGAEILRQGTSLKGIIELSLMVPGGSFTIKWDNAMRPGMARLLRERARQLEDEYEAL